MPDRKFRIHLPAFEDKHEALDWIDGLRRSGALPAEAELYEPDSLDRERHGYTARDLIVAPAGDRAPHLAIRNQARPRRKKDAR
ncbi:hypothetical protein [Streptomyces sp. CC210A]|uniref:hypothetical protein n=1 Tax=Streptomyces sp. CC210A TaxID=2898184 RepID=UPI001F33DDEE|nr:hypothetical protein [Streptomyces sp. CC210A]